MTESQLIVEAIESGFNLLALVYLFCTVASWVVRCISYYLQSREDRRLFLKIKEFENGS